MGQRQVEKLVSRSTAAVEPPRTGSGDRLSSSACDAPPSQAHPGSQRTLALSSWTAGRSGWPRLRQRWPFARRRQPQCGGLRHGDRAQRKEAQHTGRQRAAPNAAGSAEHTHTSQVSPPRLQDTRRAAATTPLAHRTHRRARAGGTPPTPPRPPPARGGQRTLAHKVVWQGKRKPKVPLAVNVGDDRPRHRGGHSHGVEALVDAPHVRRGRVDGEEPVGPARAQAVAFEANVRLVLALVLRRGGGRQEAEKKRG